MKKSLYICNVETQMRHEVAALSSVFCVKTLVEKIERIVCGSSNAREVYAYLNLTARNALSLCQNK